MPPPLPTWTPLIGGPTMAEAPLPSESDQIVERYYAKHYELVHGSGRLKDAASLLHKRLERRRRPTDRFPLTVEVGAGRFEHYPVVRHQRDRYVATDIRVPSANATYRAIAEGTGPDGLEFQRMDALSLSFEDGSVDRLVASCLLIHLPDPMAAVKEWQRVCGTHGVIDMLAVWFELRFARKPLLLFGLLGAVLFFIGVLTGIAAVLYRIFAGVGFRPLLTLIEVCLLLGSVFFATGLLAELMAAQREEIAELRRRVEEVLVREKDSQR